MDKARAHLGDLHDLAAKTERAERNILAAAEKRHAEVCAAIERARPGVEAAGESAQQRYIDLVAERGKLEVVIAKARSATA
jgi:vacuolar-type H+-ATPase subunit H